MKNDGVLEDEDDENQEDPLFEVEKRNRRNRTDISSYSRYNGVFFQNTQRIMLGYSQ